MSKEDESEKRWKYNENEDERGIFEECRDTCERNTIVLENECGLEKSRL
jgi:hypothetical protein